MAIHSHILHNGVLREASEPLLLAGQAGLLAGWGVQHAARQGWRVLGSRGNATGRACCGRALLSVTMPPDAGRNRAVTKLRLIAVNGRPNCTLRLVVVRNGGSMWAGPLPDGRVSDVIALTADSKDWGDSVRLNVQANGRFAAGEFAAAKILSQGANLVWAERAHQQGFDEVVLLNEFGRVAECTSANIFAVSGDDVFTPPVSDGCLPGITREVLLQELQVLGVRILSAADDCRSGGGG